LNLLEVAAAGYSCIRRLMLIGMTCIAYSNLRRLVHGATSPHVLRIAYNPVFKDRAEDLDRISSILVILVRLSLKRPGRLRDTESVFRCEGGCSRGLCSLCQPLFFRLRHSLSAATSTHPPSGTHRSRQREARL